MADLDYISSIRDNASALADAAESAGPDAQVPSCPEWSVADLLGHMGTVHRWAASNCDREPSKEFMRSRDAGIEVPDDRSGRPAWVREGAALLADTLAAHSPDDPCWTFAPPATVGFWCRRQAHETAMHRVDAQLAAGAVQPIDAPLAADGIDELLWLLPNRPWAPDKLTGASESLHLHCDDVEGEWLLRLAPTGLEVERVHAKGDVAVRGAASDLLVWLMGRGPIEPLEVFGDEAQLARWREVANF
ncbi:MAG: maleylpyruvate isomerase family mycothiol-dependent enzyme [Acidimicrobiia bacterium]|nr:maleylpyruvate isomerase family mycothiol-dependent enzyme [Acidimicrobiia bacterium]